MIARLQRRVKEGGNYFAAPPTDVKFFSSGCKPLDLILGGGWAEGTVINIIGDKSTGKTLLCIEAAANFIRKYDKKCRVRYIETEAAFHHAYAGALGLPIDRVEFPKNPVETVEGLFNDLCKQANSSVPILTIVDSLDALSDEGELEREFGKGSFGAQKAKDMSKMFRMLIRQMHENMTLIVVSQIRDKIGVTFGRTWTRTGGRALDFYTSQALVLAQLGERLKTTQSGVERVTGVKIRAKMDKNKISLPYREADFDLVFGFGIDDASSCIQWLLKNAGPDDLKSLDIDPAKVKSFSRKLIRNREDYRALLPKLHKLVEQRWSEIETSFLPTWKKYD